MYTLSHLRHNNINKKIYNNISKYILLKQIFNLSFNKKNKNNNNNNIIKRVRFAPSPSGSLHIGGARTALYNYLYIKNNNYKYNNNLSSFILRIEDTDQNRSTKISEINIINDLKWLGIEWDEGPDLDEQGRLYDKGEYGPYHQSKRFDIYNKYINILLNTNNAYLCFCTKNELNNKKNILKKKNQPIRYDGTCSHLTKEEIQKNLDNNIPYTIRFRTPKNKIIEINDIVQGIIKWNTTKVLDDFIIQRSNGLPMYNFTVAIDDIEMKITDIIRANEHLTNTLKQCLIYDALNYNKPNFIHCSIILNEDGKTKLSKRDNSSSINDLKNEGYLKEAILNYLILLGWNDKTTNEIFTKNDLIKNFNINNLTPSSACISINKLNWFNSYYLKEKYQNDYDNFIELLNIQFINNNIIINNNLNNNEILILYYNKIIQLFLPNLIKLKNLSEKLINLYNYNIIELINNNNKTKKILYKNKNNTLNIIKFIIKEYENNTFPFINNNNNINDILNNNNNNINNNELIWKEWVNKIENELNIKKKDILHPLRILLTGELSGPDIGKQIEILNLTNLINDLNLLKSSYISLEDRIIILKRLEKNM